MVGIYYKLLDIYTLHTKEVDMNKNSNVSLICGGVNYRRSRFCVWTKVVVFYVNIIYVFFFFLKYKNTNNVVFLL